MKSSVYSNAINPQDHEPALQDQEIFETENDQLYQPNTAHLNPTDNFYLKDDKIIRKYKEIFAYLTELIPLEEEKEFSLKDFENFMSGLDSDYEESCRKSSLNFVKKTLKVMAKFSVHNFCYMKGLEYLEEKSSGCTKIFKMLHDCLNDYIRDYFRM